VNIPSNEIVRDVRRLGGRLYIALALFLHSLIDSDSPRFIGHDIG